MSAHAATVARLQAALEELAGALSEADLDRVLAAEPRLSEALESVSLLPVDAVDLDARAAIEAARSALLRCQRLGAAMVEFTRISLDPCGESAYTRNSGITRPVRGGSMEMRG